jgi:hypothetical protein
MTMQVFPLPAKLKVLQAFVNSYLNNVFPQYEAGYFRAFLPYVYLMVVNYGKMSAQVAADGWLSQREVLFNIPLEWYLLEGDRLVFYDWAQVAPFIYVDNELSITLGREVYGWPKKLVTMSAEDNLWMEDPVGPLRVASLQTTIVPQLYRGERPQRRTFLEFYKGSSDTFTELPPRLSNPYMPPVYASNMMNISAGLANDAFQMLRGMRFFMGEKAALRPSLNNMAHDLVRMMDPTAKNLGFNCINLKQFRSVERPDVACYKGITNSRMEVRQINRAGPLGGVQQLMGDPSGNIRILLHRYASLPILETLGLEVPEREVNTDPNVQLLRPFFPYWLNLDMRYGEARTVAERTLHAKQGESAAMRILTTDGTVAQELIGPTEYPNSTLRVMPLLAKAEKLSAFCEEYLNQPLSLIEGGLQVKFEPWGDNVYLVATSNEDIIAPQNNAGRLKDNAVSFYLPVRMYVAPSGEKLRLHTVGLLPVLAYTDSDTVANSGSEVQGIPTTFAPVISPPSTWMQESGPSEATPQNLLEMSTLVFPGVGVAQPAENRTLLELRAQQLTNPSDVVEMRFTKELWGQELIHDFHKRLQGLMSPHLEASRGLALELLGSKRPLNIITLKQFRDATQLNRACYQSLVQFEQHLEKVYDLRELDADLQVRVHDFSSKRIVETLGLIPASTDYEGANVVYTLQPVRPFWMKVAMSSTLGVSLFSRHDSDRWSVTGFKDTPTYFKNPNPCRYKNGLSDLLDEIDLTFPQRLAVKVRKWKHENHVQAAPHASEPPKAEQLPIPDPSSVVEAIPPQWILEQVLSREWEHWGNPRWYQKQAEIQHAMDEEKKQLAPGQTVSKERQREIRASFRMPDFHLPKTYLPPLSRKEYYIFENSFIALRVHPQEGEEPK